MFTGRETPAMTRSSRARSLVFSGLAHLGVISGISVLVLSWLGFLASWVHEAACANMDLHSIPAHLLYTYGGFPIPYTLTAYIVFTVLLTAVSERLVSREADPHFVVRIYPPSIALVFIGMFAVSVRLWVADLDTCFSGYCHPDLPFFWSYCLGFPACLIGLSFLILFIVYKRTVYLAIFSILPIGPTLKMVNTFSPQVLKEKFRFALPMRYPEIAFVWGAIWAVTLCCLVLCFLGPWRTKTKATIHTSLVILGLWLWALFIHVSAGTLTPFLLLLLIMVDNTLLIECALFWIRLSFMLLWCVIVAIQVLRYLRRRRYTSRETDELSRRGNRP